MVESVYGPIELDRSDGATAEQSEFRQIVASKTLDRRSEADARDACARSAATSSRSRSSSPFRQAPGRGAADPPPKADQALGPRDGRGEGRPPALINKLSLLTTKGREAAGALNGIKINSGPQFRGQATGGPVIGGETLLVGERGPEIFVPNSSGKIIPNDKLGSAGGGVHYHYELTVMGDIHADSKEDVVTQMQRLASFSGRV